MSRGRSHHLSPPGRGRTESPGEGVGSSRDNRFPPHPDPLPIEEREPTSRRRLLAWLATLGLAPFAAPSARAAEEVCRPLAFEGARYTICRVDLRRMEVRLHWKKPDGQPYGSVRALAEALKGEKFLFATNGGMYHEDLAPVGLYVEGGREHVRVNTASGRGNFHLKPNGVFWVGRGRAGILETGRYLKEKPSAEYATQSGPMLVIGGKLHPRITEEGPSRKRRNGVGLVDPQTLVFAISEEAVSFGAFARLFRDELGCRDALFLDGSISALAMPGAVRLETLFPAGPIVSVTAR